jgi:hypothetical protein
LKTSLGWTRLAVPTETSSRPSTLWRLARRNRTLRDPKGRDLENLIVEALQAHSTGDLEEAIHLYGHALRIKEGIELKSGDFLEKHALMPV